MVTMIASIVCAVASVVIMLCQILMCFGNKRRHGTSADELNYSDIENQEMVNSFMKEVVDYGLSKDIQVEVASESGNFELNYVDMNKGAVMKICNIILPDTSEKVGSNIYMTCLSGIKEHIDKFIVDNLEEKNA